MDFEIQALRMVFPADSLDLKLNKLLNQVNIILVAVWKT